MLDQVQTKATTSATDNTCGHLLREDALCLSNKNGDSTHDQTQAQVDADKVSPVNPRMASVNKTADDVRTSADDPLPLLLVSDGSGQISEDSAHQTKEWTASIYPVPLDRTDVPAGDPPVIYDDTSGIDRRRFYIPQPNGYSCAPTSLSEALFDFNSSGGNSGLHFDGSTYADPNSRMAMRQAVERAEQEPEKDFGSIDDEARYAGQFGLSTKLHFDPDSGVSITTANVDQAMTALDSALAAGHGVIVNVPHHFVYCAGKTADGRYIMGDPADANTSTWNYWRMSNEMDHQYDPFNDNNQWTPTGFVEVWNPNKPLHDHVVSLGYPRLELPNQKPFTGIPVGQYQSKWKR